MNDTENLYEFCHANNSDCSDPVWPDEPTEYTTNLYKYMPGRFGKFLDWCYKHKALRWLHSALRRREISVCLTHKLLYDHGLWPRETKYGTVYVPESMEFTYGKKYVVQVREMNTDE